MTWMPSANVDAQTAHVFAGAYIVLAASEWRNSLVAWAMLAAWIAVKEYGFDLIEEGDSVKSSTIDACWYVVGGLLGTVTYLCLTW